MRFITDIKLDFGILTQYYKKCVYASNKLIGILLILAGAAGTVLYVARLPQAWWPNANDAIYRAFWTIGIMLIAVGLLEALYPYIASFTTLRKIKKNRNGKVPLSELRFKEKIYQYEETDFPVMDYKYSRIKKVVEVDGYYYLLITKYMGIIVSKAGFKEGTAEDFLGFIMKKCPDAEYKRM